mgnify:CR=1 FL=1
MITKLSGNTTLCNSYFLGDYGKDCILVDPGDNSNGRLDRFIDNHFKTLSAVLLTHGHYDHILGLKSLKHQAPVYLGIGDERFFTDSKYNLYQSLTIDNIMPILLYGGETLKLSSIEIQVIATPFHTEGSVCYYLKQESALLSGDTLFHLSYGRTDLPGGNPLKIENSLRKLIVLPKETKVYPGHGESTTLENELRFNPGFSFL